MLREHDNLQYDFDRDQGMYKDANYQYAKAEDKLQNDAIKAGEEL